MQPTLPSSMKNSRKQSFEGSFAYGRNQIGTLMKLMVLEPNPIYGGGSEGMALAISRELAARGHDIYLLHDVAGSMLPAYQEFATGVYRLSLSRFELRAPFATLRSVSRIGDLVRKLGIDVIFCSHPGYIQMAAFLRFIYGIPFCFHLGLAARYAGLSRLSRIGYRWIGAGVAPSRHTRETWRQAGWPSETLLSLPNWVDTQRFRPFPRKDVLRQELGIPQQCRCIVFVGRVSPVKGVETLIRALPRIRSSVAGAILVIVGIIPPEYKIQFDRIIDGLDHEDRQLIVLRSASSTPEKYFAAADVACVPSSWDEPFGLTLLEAMSCALPVVATRVGIFFQMLGEDHRDLLVSPNDHQALADRLIWWLTHPKAGVECGLRLRRRAIQQYGSKQSMDGYEATLEKLILQRAPGGSSY
jgi:glycosyltransferase involved in cell wall biosynthesis